MTERKQRVGSSKIITAVEPGVVSFKITDGWSAFDRGTSPQLIEGLGKARCACAVESFKRIKTGGVATHFIEQVADDTIHVQEFGVPGQQSLSGKLMGEVMNAEWLTRGVVAGSMLERLQSGVLKPEDLGFAPETKIEIGMQLPKVIIECTTKFESVDRPIDEAETRRLNNLSEEDYYFIRMLNGRAFDAVSKRLRAKGFDRWDGKQEYGRLYRNGGYMMVDVAGTQDEDRILKDGELYCKDLIRNYLKSLPWYQDLIAAKKAYPNDKSKWPEYPRLPDELAALISARYKEVAFLYAGVRI